MIDLIGFDGDDTPWHNERFYWLTQEGFRTLLASFIDGGVDLDARLLQTERRNLRLFGWGVKGFTLSMIETAIEVSRGRVGVDRIRAILDMGKKMLAHPVELFPGAREAVEALTGSHRLILITKGDLFHQESKIARSGLGELFESLEVVAEKDERTYSRILARLGARPERFVMIGNSLRSDVLPVVALGGRAIYIPFHLTTALEDAEAPVGAAYWELPDIGKLPELIASIADT